jgi:hypothetical protein
MKSIVSILISLFFFLITLNAYSQSDTKQKPEQKKEAQFVKKDASGLNQAQPQNASIKNNTENDVNATVPAAGVADKKSAVVSKKKFVRSQPKKAAASTLDKDK